MRNQIIVIVLAVTFLAAAVLFIRHIDRPRIVASAVAPDGTEFCVVQKLGGELFTTSCYYRKPGGQWGWFYYDHEDWYWGRGRAEIDPIAKRISIIRNGRVTVTFDWEFERFRLLRAGYPERELVGSQQLKPLGWNITGK